MDLDRFIVFGRKMAGIENGLDLGPAGEVGLVLDPGLDRFDEAFEIGWGFSAVQRFPFHCRAAKDAVDFELGVGGIEVDLDRCLVAVEVEAERVLVRVGPASRVNRSKGSVSELRGDDCGVVGVEFVFADLIPLSLVEAFEPTMNGCE